MGKPVDPFTFEIIKNKLVRVAEEAVIALVNVSGTAITGELHDLMVAIYRANGDLLISALGFMHHLTSAVQSIRHLIDHYSQDPGIFEDDLFFHNDSFTGAMHAPDVYLISPIHWRGKLTGFVATFVHVTDIGAINPGGFCPSAKTCHEEGFMSKGLKLIERGKLKKDVFDTILNVSRDPGMVGLDLKSQMAANHVAKQRMHNLYEDYGVETVDAVGEDLIDQSERLLRRRLSELPDGVWRSRQYYDFPGKTMQIVLAATKEGDHLRLDFTGTSEQADVSINCSRWAGIGAAIAPVFPLLAWDMVWNQGIIKPIDVVVPEGTLVNARRPAPVSVATVGVVVSVNNLSLMVISKMLGASQRYKDRATAIWAGTYNMDFMAGVNSDGEYSVWCCPAVAAYAGGAGPTKDGVDAGGDIPNLVLRQSNAERDELDFPILEPFRRFVPDSGGPGKFRGGVGFEFARTPHGSLTPIEVTQMSGKGDMAPLAYGLFGGYPGCTADIVLFRESNISELPNDLRSIKGEKREHLTWGVYQLNKGDLVYGRWTGGGGYGDPLDRDPAAVLKDILEGLVTEGPARDIYGVVVDFDHMTVDDNATYHRRLAIREERLGAKKLEVDVGTRGKILPSGFRINEYLQLADSGEEKFVQCTWCGKRICPGSAHWKENVVSRKVSPAKAGPFRPENGPFFLWEFFCPGCATLLEVEVTFEDDVPLVDEIFRWTE